MEEKYVKLEQLRAKLLKNKDKNHFLGLFFNKKKRLYYFVSRIVDLDNQEAWAIIFEDSVIIYENIDLDSLFEMHTKDGYLSYKSIDMTTDQVMEKYLKKLNPDYYEQQKREEASSGEKKIKTSEVKNPKPRKKNKSKEKPSKEISLSEKKRAKIQSGMFQNGTSQPRSSNPEPPATHKIKGYAISVILPRNKYLQMMLKEIVNKKDIDIKTFLGYYWYIMNAEEMTGEAILYKQGEQKYAYIIDSKSAHRKHIEKLSCIKK